MASILPPCADDVNASRNINMVPPLIVVADGETIEIDIAILSDEGATAEIRTRLLAAGTLYFDISNLPTWAVSSHVLRFVADFRGAHQLVRFRAGDDQEPVADLFNVLLGLIARGRGPVVIDRAVQAAIEAAAVLYPAQLEIACSQILARVRELGIRGYSINRIVADAKRRARASASAATSNDSAGESLNALLPDAPLAFDALVPAGWAVDTRGVFKLIDESTVPMAHAPVLILRRFVEFEGGAESVEIAWLRDGRWIKRVVDRGAIATARKIIDLASFGMPVTSENAKEIVQFLADFEATNLPFLPLGRITRHLGWHGIDGFDGFVWGRTHINGDSPPMCLADGRQIDGRIAFVGRSNRGIIRSCVLEVLKKRRILLRSSHFSRPKMGIRTRHE